jgi:Gram-negative bacterial TonB protein C-terminal
MAISPSTNANLTPLKKLRRIVFPTCWTMGAEAMRQFYHMKFIWIAALAAAAVTIMGAARAQDDPAYLAEYKAYNQAMSAGDREAAERHGLAAWQAAEEALGDNQLTGILAFNYGQLVIFTDPKAARTALRRAKKLQNDGVVELPETDLNLFLAYAEFAVSDGRWRQANQLRNALIAIEEKGAPTNSDIATMWYKLAFSDFSRKRYKHAIESASKAETAFLVSSPENYRQRANAILIGGAARLLPFPLTVDNTQAAHNEFSRAQNLFPPQKDLDSFDPLLAQILGWDAAADAVLGSLGEEDYPDHENIDQNDPTQYYSPIFEQEEKSDEECGVGWDRDPPKYPSQAGWKGYIGAVIIGYNLSDDTLVHDARILAEVPTKIFGDAVLSNMETWRLAAPISNDPACRLNRLAHFTFMMSD